MADAPEQEHLDLVAGHVRQGRLALRLSIEDAAKSVGVSPVTWIRVEKGKAVRSLTYSAIERALHWRPGSVEKVLADGSAPGFEEIQPANKAGGSDAADADEDPVERLIRDIYADESMPEERKQEMVRLIRRAEAQREAEIRAAQDELNSWRHRRAAG